MKETTTKANTPAKAKWGTIDWIKENKFSTMDSKRRVRVKKAIGDDAWSEIAKGPTTCCLHARLDSLIGRFDIELGKKNLQTLEKAFCTVCDFEKAVFDEAVARSLAKAWGL